MQHSATSIEELLSNALASIEDGVFVVDEQGELRFANHTARHLLAMPEAYTGPAHLAISHETVAALLYSEESQRLELTLENERVFSVQLSVVPGIGRTFIMHDITHFKELDGLKNRFVANVSQDLRSPLTAILGYVELLGRVGPLTEQQERFVERILISAQSISGLVADLLELTRIEESDPDRAGDSVAMEHIVAYAVATVESHLIAKRHQLSVENNAQRSLVYGDGQRLKQMVRNLLQNAILYTSDGGEIIVRLWNESDLMILQVQDNGVGIPLEEQSLIFERLYRASNVRHLHSGSGLGLAIVKSTVDRHNGRIWVDSRVGQGSIFTIVLPAQNSLHSSGIQPIVMPCHD